MNAWNKKGEYHKSAYSDRPFINISVLLMVFKELFNPNAKRMMGAANTSTEF